MIEEGCLENPKVGAIFGLHVTSNHHTGRIGYRSGPLMASSDELRVFVRGSQTHGAMPWRGVDPIVVGAQVSGGIPAGTTIASFTTQQIGLNPPNSNPSNTVWLRAPSGQNFDTLDALTMYSRLAR